MLREIFPSIAIGLLVGDAVYMLAHIPEYGSASIKVAVYALTLAALQAVRALRRKP